MVRFLFAAAGAAALHCRKSKSLSKDGKNVLKCDWGNGYKIREAFCGLPKKKDMVCTLTDDEWSLLADKAVRLRNSWIDRTKRSYTMADGSCKIKCDKCGITGVKATFKKAYKLTCWELQEGTCNAKCFKKGSSVGTWNCPTGDCHRPKPSDKISVCTNLDSKCPRWELKMGTCSEKCGKGKAVKSFYCSTGVDSDCTSARPKDKTVKCVGNDPTCPKPNFRFAAMVINSTKYGGNWSAEDGKKAIRELKMHVKEMRKIFLQDSWGAVRIETVEVPNKVIDMKDKVDDLKMVLNGQPITTVEMKFRATVELEHELIAKQQTMIDRAGVDLQLETLDLYFMLHPNEHTGTLGRSHLNNRTAWGDCRGRETTASLNGKILVDHCSKAMAHELYHSLGLNHASARFSSARLPNDSYEYGHQLDIMGNNSKTGMKYLGLPMRYKLGWAPRSQLHLVTDLTKEQTFAFASFEKPTSDMIGVMIPLECTSVFISRDEAGNFLVEYALQLNNNPAAFSAHRAVQDKGIVKVGDRVYEPMADLTIERTAQGARLYTGRKGVTHADTDLVSDVLKHKLAYDFLINNCAGRKWCQSLLALFGKNVDKVQVYALTKRFEKGCPALRQPEFPRTCGKKPGYVVHGMGGERGVIYRRAHPRHADVQRYECHDGVWILESGHFRHMRR